MKIIKGGLLIISVALLFFSFLIANVVFSISWSISYNEIEDDLPNTVLEVLEKEYDLSEMISENEKILLDYCLPHESYSFKLNSIEKNISCHSISQSMEAAVNEATTNLEESLHLSVTQTVLEDYSSMKEYCVENENYYLDKFKKNISCQDVKESKQAVIDSLVEDSVVEIYYKNYSKCDFWDCIEKTGSTQFLVSQKAKDYWDSWLKKLILFSLFLLIPIYFFIDNKYNSLFVVGGAIILSGFPLLKIESFVLAITKPFFKGLEFINYQDTSAFKSIISVFFSKSIDVFYICLALGMVLLVAWVVIRFWSFFTGRDKKLFSKKDVQEMIQKELKTKGNKKVNV